MTCRLARCVWPATLAVLLGVLAVVAMPAACDSIASVVGGTIISPGPRVVGAPQVQAGPAHATRALTPTAPVATRSPIDGERSGVARVVSAGSVRDRHTAPVLVALTVVVLLALVVIRRPLGFVRSFFAVSDPAPRTRPGPRAPPPALRASAHSRPQCAPRLLAHVAKPEAQRRPHGRYRSYTERTNLSCSCLDKTSGHSDHRMVRQRRRRCRTNARSSTALHRRRGRPRPTHLGTG